MTDVVGLRRQQGGVALGVASAAAISLAVFLWPAAEPPTVDRATLWAACVAPPAICLAIAVARLAGHRVFSAEDIGGAGLAEPTRPARLLQALIQNTLEQAVLASLAYGAWIWLSSPATAGLAARCAGLFVIGRLLFFAGYRRGAPARSLGFGLTFYPTVGLLALTLPKAIAVLAASGAGL